MFSQDARKISSNFKLENDEAEVHKRNRLQRNFTDFLTNFTLPCYHYLVETRVTSYER